MTVMVLSHLLLVTWPIFSFLRFLNMVLFMCYLQLLGSLCGFEPGYGFFGVLYSHGVLDGGDGMSESQLL